MLSKRKKEKVILQADLLRSLIIDIRYLPLLSLAPGMLEQARVKPSYLLTLRSIANAYNPIDLYANPNAAREFITACIEASSSRLMEFEKNQDLPEDYVKVANNPRVVKMMVALQKAGNGNYSNLHELINEFKEFQYSNATNYYAAGEKSVAQIGKAFEKFKKDNQWGDQPELTVLFDFIFQSSINPHEFKITEYHSLSLLNFANFSYPLIHTTELFRDFCVNTLLNNDSLFMINCDTAEKFAILIRPDCYGITLCKGKEKITNTALKLQDGFDKDHETKAARDSLISYYYYLIKYLRMLMMFLSF